MEFLLPYISYQAQWQTDVLLFLQSLRNDPLNVFFYLISWTGAETFYIVVICIIFWCISKRVGYLAGFSLITADMLNAGLKSTFQIPRPIGHNGMECVQKPFNAFESSFSFPSGHSMGAGSFWFSLITSVKARWVTILGIAMMILIPFSRLYLGVHTPVDVTAGLILGILVALIVGRLAAHAAGKKKYLIFVLVIPFVVWSFFMPNPEFWKSLGTLVGMLSGYLIESEAIQFKMPKGAASIAVRIFIGLSVLLLIKVGMKLVLPDTLISDAFRYFCIGLWVTAGAPAVFVKLKK